MRQERDILDDDYIFEVMNNGHTIWENFDPNDETRVTMKFVYKNRYFILYKDGPEYWMKELLNELPEDLKPLD